MKFNNRWDAGVLLSEKLKKYKNKKDVLILALPRGGVVVAKPISEKLQVSMDLLLVKKLGVPGHEELAFGAIAMNGHPIFNDDILNQLDISEDEINQIIFQKQHELSERNKLYRHNQPAPDVKNKIIIIVDDGIATGATIRAAIQAIKMQRPQKIILATPVADKNICDELATIVDEVICLYQPPSLSSVGYWYADFEQVSDEDVIRLISK